MTSRNLLFARTTTAWVLVHEGCEGNSTFIDAFLYPEVGFNVFVGIPLICLDEVLEDIGVGIRKNDPSGLRGCMWIPSGMLSEPSK